MPLAFDLISTLVIGVTLPVATTLLAKSPFSTFASLVGSIFVPPRVAATATTTSATTATATIVIMSKRFFFFLPFPFPLATTRLPTLCALALLVGTFQYEEKFRAERGKTVVPTNAVHYLDRFGKANG